MLRRLLLPFVMLLGASVAFAATPVEEHGLLQINGDGKVVDEHGNAVQLRGMSLFWSVWGAAWWNESAVDQAVDYLGCEILRAPMAVGSKEDTGDTPKDVVGGYLTDPETNVAWVRTVVNQAIARGIYVIIDWHDHEAQNPNHTAKAVTFFQQMAREYGNVPNVLFEIYNEPITTDWDGLIKPYAETVVDAIRSTNGVDGSATRNIIIVGTPFYSQLGPAVLDNRLADPNVAYALHFYAAQHTLNGSSVGQSAKDAVDAKLPIFVTEWGTVLANGKGTPSLAESKLWIDWMSSNHVSWCNWSIFDKNEDGETSSMFATGTTPLGPWDDSRLTASGKLLLQASDRWLPQPTTSFSVSPSLLKFFYVPGTKQTKVIKGGNWTATSEQDWLEVTPSSGTVGQVVSVAAEQYDGKTENRTGSIDFSDENGNSAKVKVVQRFDQGNLALGKPANASSSQDGYPPSAATDGDESSRWGSLFQDNQWIYVDLGKPTAFSRVVLIWEAAYSKHFQIRVAPDGVLPQYPTNYTTVYDSGTVPPGLTGDALRMNIPIPGGASGRYVMMYSYTRITTYGSSLWEFEIFSDPAIAVWGPYSEVYAGGGEEAIELWSNRPWTATSDADWLTIRQTSGDVGYSHPAIAWGPNYTGAARTANLTFTAATATKVVSVTQPAETKTYPGGYYLDASVPGPMTELPDGTAEISIPVTTNWGWSATVPNADWLTLDVASSDLGNTAVHGFATPNLTGQARTALVVIRGFGGLLVDAWVTQNPTGPFLAVIPSVWSPSTGDAEATALIVTSNLDWSAASSDPSWLTVEPASGSGTGLLSLYVTANTGTAYRMGTVLLTSSDGSRSATVIVTQAVQPPSASVQVAPTSWTAPGRGGSQTIAVTANVSWTATSSDTSWLTVTAPAGGTGDGSITLNANANGTGASRTATVTVSGGGASATVTVTQAVARGKVLEPTPASFTVDASGGMFTITINSNTDWWAWSEVDWLTGVTERGSGNGTLSFTVSANTGAEARTTKLKLHGTGANGEIAIDIDVTQSGAQGNRWTPPASGGTQAMMMSRSGSWTAASSDSSWLTVSPTSGTGNASIAMTARANTGPARTATVTVTGGGATKSVQVSQAAVGQSLPTTLRITNSWPTGGPHGKGGYCGDVIVTNNTGAAVDWKVTFSLPEAGTIYDSWNGIWSQAGSRITVEGVAWNNILPAGQSTHSVGFCVNR